MRGFLSKFSYRWRWAISPDIFAKKKHFFVLLTWDPKGANFQNPTLSSKNFELLLNLCSQCTSQKHCLGVLKFWVSGFSHFFSILVIMGPFGGGGNLKRYTCFKSLLNCSTFSEFCSQWCSETDCSVILKFRVSYFKDFSPNFTFRIATFRETKNCNWPEK